MQSAQKTRAAASWIASALLVYAVWARSGIYPPFQPLMLSISAVLALTVFFLPAGRFEALLQSLKRDPVFWAGGLFLLLLAAQWANTGYLLLYDEAGRVFMDQQPPRWLPWSINSDSGAQLLTWFVPVWILLLSARHLLDRSGIRQVLYIIVWNSALCAGVGIVQQLAGAGKMLWLWEIPGGSFFATFGYTNHGAAYFYLNAAVAAGLVHDSATRGKPPVQTAVWILCGLLNLTAAFFTLSRAGAIGGLLVSAAAAFVLLVSSRLRLRSAGFLNGALVALVILATGAVLLLGAGEGRLSEELSDTVRGGRAGAAVEERMKQVPQAWAIFKQYPLFGSGGWGYRWLAKAHIPMEEWPDWQRTGRANVHCDPLQFLSEFGLFGAACISVVLGTLLLRGVQGGRPRPLFGWVCGGLLLVFVHSVFDLPFRCPAILFEWCFLMAALPFWRKPRTA